ncbi:DUF2785 domain-containing protein [Lacticaseibacillus yichunensis]|uniref:DUF2785 domain-containing protein n=1 Tax=Lacticaseibacillus yichunensis TaxID=2486015 RepID=A0ABW4CP31_9LACO|nr:DUF2785 domain-containing protein [Lacticaseibacillus yichunensis]
MATEQEAVQTVKDAMQTLRQQLLDGKVFKHLPDALGEIYNARPSFQETPFTTPDDDMRALARISSISKRIKGSNDPKISDEELSFLMDHLASLSPAVRDKGVFFLMGDLFQADAFTVAQIDWLATYLQRPDVLFAHILEPQNDAVFLRSFAVMLLSGLVYADSRYHVLSAEAHEALTLNFATYIILERDGRGYVDPQGWAHAYTHIGNLADELSQVKVLSRGHKLFLMATVLEGWQRMDDALVFGEDQRIAGYLTNLAVKHQFYAESLVMCLTSWQKRVTTMRPRESEAFWNRWYNRLRLLEALIIRSDMPKGVIDYLQKIIDVY